MKQLILTLALTCFLINSVKAQTPFTTSVLEARVIKAVNNPENPADKRFSAVTDSFEMYEFLSNKSTDTSLQAPDLKDIDFFNSSGLSYTILQHGESRASVKTQVLHYKLYLATPTDSNMFSKNTVNLPLMVLSKLSSNYDSINASSALDLLDYEASPITLRIMPSFKFPFKNYNQTLFLGSYADARIINTYNNVQQAYYIDVVGSFGAGVTYQGNASAANLTAENEYVDGRFSISAMFQIATGNKDLIASMFKTEENYVMSIQSYLAVKLFEKESLNMKIGYQYLFTETIIGTKNVFSVSLGI